MTSQINIDNIDANFPIAGEDNSSQGFRDNFAAIKIALTTATDEISLLQEQTVKLNSENDFDYFEGGIRKALISESGFLAANNASIEGNLDFSYGHYHKSSINTNTTFTVENWPSSGIFAQVRLEVSPVVNSQIGRAHV